MRDYFSESEMSSDEEELPIITLHGITSAIFVQIMYYIYQDSCDVSQMFTKYSMLICSIWLPHCFSGGQQNTEFYNFRRW